MTFQLPLAYVNDILIVGNDSQKKKIDALKKALSKSIEIKDFGLTKQMLGMKIT